MYGKQILACYTFSILNTGTREGIGVVSIKRTTLW